ncbi:MAG: restriction endonuclease subunit S [Acetobacterium sp.]|nr:restriction endonuclease subunit S [Acetobacterium sp.]
MGKWEMVRLYEICDLLNGYAFKSSDYIEHSNTLNCRMSNIRPNGTFNILYNAKYLPDEYIKKYENFRLTDGDVIIAMTDMANEPKILGVPTIVKTEGYKCLLNQRVGKLIYNERKISADYLCLVLDRDSVKKYYQKFSSGGLQINLGKSDLLSLEIPLPSLEIQQKIAVTLNTTTALFKLHQQQLAELDALIQSVFYQMFGDPVSNEKGWEIKNFRNTAIIDTTMIKEFDSYSKVPHIGIENIEKETGKIINLRLVEDCGLTSGKYLFSNKHVIYSKIRPNLNKVALPTFTGLCSADAYPILPIEGKTDRYYLAYVLRSDYFLKYILDFSGRTNIPKVNKSQIEGFNMPVPPIELQTQFAAIVQKIEQQKALIQQSIDETKTLFDSLMSRYFD